MKVAVVQMKPELNQTESNFEKIAHFCSRSSDEAAELVLFPECALSGYILTREEATDLAEPIPGPTSDKLVDLCKEHRLHLMVGTLELEGGRLYNTSILASPEGYLGKYRKAHLPFLGVDRFVEPGESLGELFVTRAGKLGALICFDLRFPEAARVLALNGAQILLAPSAWHHSSALYPELLVPTRSVENRVFIMAADQTGSARGVRFLGRSLITAPDGEVLAETGASDETLLFADIDVSLAEEKKLVFKPGEFELDLFGGRRPELYSGLTKES